MIPSHVFFHEPLAIHTTGLIDNSKHLLGIVPRSISPQAHQTSIWTCNTHSSQTDF